MPKGRTLTLAEREEIARMNEAGASGREIAKKLARSKTVVLNFLKNPAQYAQIKRSGRKRALSSEDERRLYAALFQQRTTSSSSSAQGSYDRGLSGIQSQSVAQEELQHVPGVSSVAGAATNPDGSAPGVTEREEKQCPIGHQDIKKSAEQIKKEFNVPLSTRRIQQLLSDWRRDARRAQDRQQQVQQTPRLPPTVRAVGDLDGGDSSAIGGAVTQGRSSESSVISAENDAVAQPFIDSGGALDETAAEPVEPATGEDATPLHQEVREPAQPAGLSDLAGSAIAAPSYLGEPDRQPVDDASSELHFQESSDAMTIENAVAAADPSTDMSTIQV